MVCGPVNLRHVERAAHTRVLVACLATIAEALHHGIFEVDVEEVGYCTGPGNEIGDLKLVLPLNLSCRMLARESLSRLTGNLNALLVQVQDGLCDSASAVHLAVKCVEVLLPIA